MSTSLCGSSSLTPFILLAINEVLPVWKLTFDLGCVLEIAQDRDWAMISLAMEEDVLQEV